MKGVLKPPRAAPGVKSHADIRSQLLDPGVVAILRADSPAHMMNVVAALKEGGIRAIEVTMTTPNAIGILKEVLQTQGQDIVMGVGTVTNVERCHAALEGGAEFIVTPVMKPDVIQLCRQHRRPIICGAYTPTEIHAAWEAGADFIKLFPADHGGPAYIKAVKAPLPEIEFIPTGGIDVNNAADFIKVGCAGIGAGSTLVSKKAIEEQDWNGLRTLAERFVAVVSRARAEMQAGKTRAPRS